MKEKPSVIIIDNSRDTTGAFNAIFYFAQYAQTDYKFIFILPRNSLAGIKVQEAGFYIEYLPLIEISKSLKNLLLYLPFLILNSLRLLMLVKKYDVQIVHVNDFYNLVGAVGKILGGKYKLLTHVRFMPDRFPKYLLKLWVTAGVMFSERVICVSKAVKKCLPTHPKIEIIYDTIPAIFSLKDSKTRYTSAKFTRLLYLAHYIPGKGQDLALEAFYLAYQKNKRLRLKFVGGDMGLNKNRDFKAQLIRRAAVLKVNHAVEFACPTKSTKVEFSQCDIALNFSESESFSFTCLEALAHGTPLIATDCGGPAELFENGKSGILVPNRDIDAMSQAILKLANNEELRKKFSGNGKEFVIKKFSIENTFDNLKRLYAGVLSR